MGDVSVILDRSQLAKLERLFAHTPAKIPRAIKAAVGRAGRAGVSHIVKELSQAIRGTAPKKTIRDRVHFVREGDSGRIEMHGRPLGLIRFAAGASSALKTRQTGVGAKVFGTTVFVPGAFVARGMKGNVHVFRRQPGATHRLHAGVGGARSDAALKIRAAYGPTPAQMLQMSPGLLESVQEHIHARLSKELDGQIARFLRQ